jgi:hypothetical protein
MPVNSTHPEYSKAKKRWDLVRKIIDNDAKEYLRDTINCANTNTEIELNRIYKEYAILTNFTNLTKEGLSGLVFRKDPICELPIELDYLKEDVTGEGLSFIQFDQRVIDEVLITGRCGILADYPQVEEGLSKKDLQDQFILPRLKVYNSESIINWRTQQVGSQVKLVLLVLEECDQKLSEDGFEWVETIQYRVFQSNTNGNIEQSIYKECRHDITGKTSYEIVPESQYELKDYEGNPWKEIPFVFIGSKNNDTAIDKIPLEDLAILNRGHYRNSADLEESGRLLGCPTLKVCGGGDPDLLHSANPKGLTVGSRTALIFPEAAEVDYLQLNETQLMMTMMQDKLEQAAKIGARLIEPSGGRETAEAARIRFAAQNSFLGIITYNCERGVAVAYRFACRYIGADENKVVHTLNKEFYSDTADPNLIAQEWIVTKEGGMKLSEFRQNLRDSEIKLDNDDDGLEIVKPEPVQPALPTTTT